MMRWKKLGLLFDPALLQEFDLAAALMPTADILDENDGGVRVYFSPRTADNKSQVRSFDFDIETLTVSSISPDPLYMPGRQGTFDDAGITLGSLVHGPDASYLYYTGWNLTVSVPFNNSVGIARLEDGMFHRLGDGPAMTRTLHEPYSCASPFVLFEEGKYRMWYASMDKWGSLDGELTHYYNIKYAESPDGIEWTRKCVVAIDYENEGEYAFGRPFVLRESGIYKMWYSYRGEFYKIGYAESRDGVAWERKDDLAGIAVSESGWDSDMIEYPCIFDLKGERYMLYNGNGYGKTGIGIARLEG